MATIAVTGASGFIGSALTRDLRDAGHEVIRFVRRATSAADEASWDPMRDTIDQAAIERADAVVHLAGEGIGEKRWTAAQKRRILESRVQGTGTVARAIAESSRANGRAPALLSGSAVGYYGLRGDEVLTETSTPGTGFLADVVKQWEEAARPAEDAGARVVYLRTGIVLGNAGALGRMLPLFRLGLGGRLGSGRQWWSWIAVADVIGMIRHAIVSPDLSGPMNVAGPDPATNREITQVLSQVLRRPAILPVPPVALAVVLGRELTNQVVMASQRALPQVARSTGYEFREPSLEGALRAAVAR